MLDEITSTIESKNEAFVLTGDFNGQIPIEGNRILKADEFSLGRRTNEKPTELYLLTPVESFKHRPFCKGKWTRYRGAKKQS